MAFHRCGSFVFTSWSCHVARFAHCAYGFTEKFNNLPVKALLQPSVLGRGWGRGRFN